MATKKLNSSDATSPSSSRSVKETKIEFLRKQVNKSYQERKLVTIGFGGVKSATTADGETSKRPAIMLVKKSSEVESKQTPKPGEASGIGLLVSNDYGSDTDSNAS